MLRSSPPSKNTGLHLLRWALFGVLLGSLCAALVFAPARWLALAIAHSSDGRVQLSHAQGTLWQGNAQLTLKGGKDSTNAMTLPSIFHWRLRPLGLLGLHLQLHAPCCTQENAPLDVRVSYRFTNTHIVLNAHSSRWPAQWLVGLGAPFNTLEPKAQLVFQTLPDLSINLNYSGKINTINGQAKLDLLALSSSLTSLNPLGSYSVLIQANGPLNQTHATLSTLEGALTLQGHGAFNGNKFAFSGHAATTTEHEQALGNLLNIIGKRQGLNASFSF